MPTVTEWAEYFYPYLFNVDDPRYTPPSEFQMAEAVAVDYRPVCLGEDRQNQAQAHYAAYIVEFRARLKAAGLSGAVTETVAGPIIEKQEGDTRVKYATSATQTSVQQVKDKLTGPGTPYSAWQAMWEMCVPATAEGQLPVRRGAIMTSFG